MHMVHKILATGSKGPARFMFKLKGTALQVYRDQHTNISNSPYIQKQAYAQKAMRD